MTERMESGACFCGAIRAELSGSPFWICYDHDDDCRKAIGGPLTIWVGYRRDQIRFLQGEPKRFSKTPGVVRSFCAECGASIASADEGLDDEIYFSIGFLDRPERFEPEAHAYWKMRLPWVEFADALPRIEDYSRDRDPNIGYPSTRQQKP